MKFTVKRYYYIILSYLLTKFTGFMASDLNFSSVLTLFREAPNFNTGPGQFSFSKKGETEANFVTTFVSQPDPNVNQGNTKADNVPFVTFNDTKLSDSDVTTWGICKGHFFVCTEASKGNVRELVEESNFVTFRKRTYFIINQEEQILYKVHLQPSYSYKMHFTLLVISKVSLSGTLPQPLDNVGSAEKALSEVEAVVANNLQQLEILKHLPNLLVRYLAKYSAAKVNRVVIGFLFVIPSNQKLKAAL